MQSNELSGVEMCESVVLLCVVCFGCDGKGSDSFYWWRCVFENARKREKEEGGERRERKNKALKRKIYLGGRGGKRRKKNNSYKTG